MSIDPGFSLATASAICPASLRTLITSGRSGAILQGVRRRSLSLLEAFLLGLGGLGHGDEEGIIALLLGHLLDNFDKVDHFGALAAALFLYEFERVAVDLHGTSEGSLLGTRALKTAFWCHAKNTDHFTDHGLRAVERFGRGLGLDKVVPVAASVNRNL